MFDYYEIDRGYSILNGSFSIGISYNEITYSYNRVITVFVGNNTTATTNYYYDNRKLIKEVCGNNIIEYIYDENNQLYGYKENNNVYFYMRDVLNNIIGIIDNNGLIVSTFDYDAYGNIINQTGTIISHFRYKGYYYDTDIELYYLKTRFYNPILLRFITPDSIEYLDSSSIIGLNLYAYCGNDPINMVDENGNVGFWQALVVGAIVGVIVAVCNMVVIEGNNVDKDYYKDSDGGYTDGVLDSGKTFKYKITEDSNDNNNVNKKSIKILNSSTYSVSELSEIIDNLNDKNDHLINKRKVLNELKWHKAAYNLGLFVESSTSADVYFNADDEGHGVFSWIMNNIYI